MIMAHLVAGYPTPSAALAVAKGLADGGAAVLEIQFPYSDPSADGSAIEEACRTALVGGFTVSEGFQFIEKVREETQKDIFLMSYAGLLFARGIKSFVADAVKAGVKGVIIPDLPQEHDEGLRQWAETYGIAVIPVIPSRINEERLQAVLANKPQYVYTTLRVGITGEKTELDEITKRFLTNLKESGTKIIGGFGIRERSQVEELAPLCNYLAVGSAFVNVIKNHVTSKDWEIEEAVREKCFSLISS